MGDYYKQIYQNGGDRPIYERALNIICYNLKWETVSL